MNIVRDFDLSAHNTLALKARADYFCTVENLDELREAVAFASSQTLPVTILGGGSNVVMASQLAGLVVHMAIKAREMVEQNHTTVTLKLGAGENWHDAVNYCLDHNWFGLENLSLIPGTVGAAPIQNIGAYGVELDSCFVELEALCLDTGKLVVLERSECQFGYRDSIFKGRAKNRFAIISVTLRLSKTPCPVLSYPALREAIRETAEVSNSGAEATPRDIADTVCRIRREKLPSPETVPNAGSFFKNPLVSGEQAERLQQRFPELVVYPQPDGRVKLAAAWLIERAGWKGIERGGVGVHQYQALVLVHYPKTGKVTGAAVLRLAADIQADIRQKFGVDLEIEPVVLGFKPEAQRD